MVLQTPSWVETTISGGGVRRITVTLEQPVSGKRKLTAWNWRFVSRFTPTINDKKAVCLLLNSIHDEISNRSFACWFCLDFSREISVQTNRSKVMYKGNRRKEVCRLFGRQKHVHIPSWAPQLPPSLQFKFHVTAEKRRIAYLQTVTAVLHYRRKIPAYFGFIASAKFVTAEILKIANLKKRTRYRLVALPLKKYRHILVLPLPPRRLPPKTRKSSSV